MSAALPRPASPNDLAVLRHPDRRTTWVSVVAMTLAEAPFDAQALYTRRLAEVHAEAPILGARLREETWEPGAPPHAETVDGDPLDAPALLRPFALDREAPVRLLVGDGGRRIAIAAHHAALDGRGEVAVLAALNGAPVRPPALPPPPGPPESRWSPVRRLLHPADRVVPSAGTPRRDVLVVRPIHVRGPHVTAQIASAAAAAVAARNAAHGRPLRRIGISLGVGGPDGIGNVATYRRVDLPAGIPVHPAVVAALASPALPGELVAPAAVLRLLAPIVDRFSDTILVSNPGRCAIPGAVRVENFPVARGRSAVAIGSCGVPDGPSTLTLRARDLSRADATALLQDVARRLDPDHHAPDATPPPASGAATPRPTWSTR